MKWSDHEVRIISGETSSLQARRALKVEGYTRSQPSIEHKLQEMRRVDNGLPRGVFKSTEE